MELCQCTNNCSTFFCYLTQFMMSIFDVKFIDSFTYSVIPATINKKITEFCLMSDIKVTKASQTHPKSLSYWNAPCAIKIPLECAVGIQGDFHVQTRPVIINFVTLKTVRASLSLKWDSSSCHLCSSLGKNTNRPKRISPHLTDDVCSEKSHQNIIFCD